MKTTESCTCQCHVHSMNNELLERFEGGSGEKSVSEFWVAAVRFAVNLKFLLCACSPVCSCGESLFCVC